MKLSIRKKKAVIYSLNFNAAHIAHLLASYQQCEELGYESILCIHQRFEPYFAGMNIKYVIYKTPLQLKKVDLSLFLFPSLHNIVVAAFQRLFMKTKILYLFHEPLDTIQSYLPYSNKREIGIILLKHIVSLILVSLSNEILLPSAKSYDLYKRKYSFLNRHYAYLPLLYPDGQPPIQPERKYFSYIGGISKDHAFEEYLSFVAKAIEEKFMVNQLNFLIASRDPLNVEDIHIHRLLNSGRLIIQQGRHLTTEEINYYYSQSYAIWNAYNRTNQSGVLANSFMLGTPGLVMKDNLSEFVRDRVEVIAINNNTDYQEIAMALKELMTKHTQYSQAARSCFLRNFYYRTHNQRFQRIIESLF